LGEHGGLSGSPTWLDGRDAKASSPKESKLMMATGRKVEEERAWPWPWASGPDGGLAGSYSSYAADGDGGANEKRFQAGSYSWDLDVGSGGDEGMSVGVSASDETGERSWASGELLLLPLLRLSRGDTATNSGLAAGSRWTGEMEAAALCAGLGKRGMWKEERSLC
jgi:hypothetical protein